MHVIAILHITWLVLVCYSHVSIFTYLPLSAAYEGGVLQVDLYLHQGISCQQLETPKDFFFQDFFDLGFSCGEKGVIAFTGCPWKVG